MILAAAIMRETDEELSGAGRVVPRHWADWRLSRIPHTVVPRPAPIVRRELGLI